MRVLALVTDAFGGRGGIAEYNRQFFRALCKSPDCERVRALPRLMPDPPEPLPDQLIIDRSGLGGKWIYTWAVIKILCSRQRFDWIFCGHVNLLPFALLLKLRLGVPVVLQIHGIEAWQPTSSRILNALASKVDHCLSVSRYTRRQFLQWTHLAPHQCMVVPNTIDLARFTPGSKSSALLDRYGLRNKQVLLTMGRMPGAERYKGFDEVLEALPEIAKRVPAVAYLVVGDGDDRARLQEKASALGVASYVIFAGQVSDAEKVDHYRLADLYVMPSRGEGFGIVYLEAIACGVQSVAYRCNGVPDAFREGELGILLPASSSALELAEACVKALHTPDLRGMPLVFSVENFTRRISTLCKVLVSHRSTSVFE